TSPLFSLTLRPTPRSPLFPYTTLFRSLSDQIYWSVEDRDTGAVRARVIMKPGDVAAMPADIRHQGYAAKRAMPLVWENASPELPRLSASVKAPTNETQFLTWPGPDADL